MSKSYRNRRKYRASSDGGTVAIIFSAILIYGLLTNHGLVTKAELVIKYTLLLVVSAAVIVLVMHFVMRLKRIKTHQTLKTIDSMTGVEFERYVAKLLVKQGYSHVSLTERYDYGVDIIAEKDGIKWGIQVKRHKNLVKAFAVRQVVTALRKYNCDRAMVVTNSQFSRVAVELARTNDCVLVERDGLARWMAA